MYGAHTYLDELVQKPYYEYKKLQPPPEMLAVMNPPNVQRGVEYLEVAANDTVIGAMLDLADVYCTEFFNDTFQKNKEKAEEWYVRALGQDDKLFPLAFTRYGDFLMWQQRSTESRDMYRVAAEFGHARGQHEYAACLISDTSSADSSSEGLIGGESYEITMEEALQYLCKASEKGFYTPSYTALAKVLVEIAEKACGTVFFVGRSPIPRVVQILNIAMETTRPRYGSSQEWEDETSKLLEYYECRKKKCSSCGQEESEAHPLRVCGTCHSVAYCSKVCQKRDYRDGHKFDCCPRQELFNFQSLRYTLPWVSKDGWKKTGQGLPRLSSTGERSLMKMVEDDTDDLYGEDDQDVDEAILVNLMFRMRKNLETYLFQELNLQGDKTPTTPFLKSQIEMFSKTLQDYPGRKNFINAMDKVRIFGNDAAHNSDRKLVQAECEHAVDDYRSQKEKYEKYRERAMLAEGEKSGDVDAEAEARAEQAAASLLAELDIEWSVDSDKMSKKKGTK